MRILFTLFCFCFSLSIVHAQSGVFHLGDTSFHRGDIYNNCEIRFDLYNNTLLDPSYPCLDSLADWIRNHPEVILEIGVHTDQRGSDTSNLKTSERRAVAIENYLISKGADDHRLVTVGYGESKPLHSQEKINATQDKNEKERLYQENRRTEFKIIHVYPKVFSLSDSVFTVGSVLPIRVLFDFDKSTIRPESKHLLDSIALFMISNPNLFIEVRNHRDSRSSTNYSSNLSKKRAESVHDYLISKNVPATQIVPKGYGETMPLVTDAYIKSQKSKDAQEQLYQINRRTELVIIGIR
jgi:outer membrane protein OmpA-like peptidoglycan-associated protein